MTLLPNNSISWDALQMASKAQQDCLGDLSLEIHRTLDQWPKSMILNGRISRCHSRVKQHNAMES